LGKVSYPWVQEEEIIQSGSDAAYESKEEADS
jgi:hypothetical protein